MDVIDHHSHCPIIRDSQSKQRTLFREQDHDQIDRVFRGTVAVPSEPFYEALHFRSALSDQIREVESKNPSRIHQVVHHLVHVDVGRVNQTIVVAKVDVKHSFYLLDIYSLVDRYDHTRFRYAPLHDE